MDYSVYIIQDRTKENQELFDGLAGDTDLGEHFKNVGAAAVADVLDANILDRYATTEKLGDDGIAIRGEMINSVSIKTELVKKDMFNEGTSRIDKFLITTITVKGNLFAPSLIEMKSETAKNKNMAKVLAWASVPQTKNADDEEGYSGNVPKKISPGIQLSSSIQEDTLSDDPNDINSYENFYYRRVLVTFYSDMDTQFRAVLYDKVFVSSYEEVYDDKDGNGKFTLVMQSIAASIFDVFVAGPSYKWSPLAFADEVSKVASKTTKTVNKAAETVDKIAGTDVSKKIKKGMDKIDSANEGLEYVTKGDITIDTLGDNVQKQTEAFRPTEIDDAIKQANDYKKSYSELTDEQKNTLKNIPGFDKMDTAEKMKYIEKLKDKK